MSISRPTAVERRPLGSSLYRESKKGDPVFQIKICGVTTSHDARQAAEAGADAIGLNFFARSPRYVTVQRAREIAATLPPEVTKVGVFVNSQADDVVETADAVGLDMIQLHGDELPSFLQQVTTRPVLRAFRCRDDGLTPVPAYLDDCRAAGRLPDAVLLDAYTPEKYGGTGKCLDWAAVSQAGDRLGGLPIVLAGGLTPENVGDAIVAAHPTAVDTAGGVEASPGVKDIAKMKLFVSVAQSAFRRVSPPG